MRATYSDLKHEIESHNKRQMGCKFAMSEYHESNIYSIKLDGRTLKIGSLREVVDALRFLNLYRAETVVQP